MPARTMALSRCLAAGSTQWTTAGGGLLDPATMTRVEDLLAAKALLPDVVPDVD